MVTGPSWPRAPLLRSNPWPGSRIFGVPGLPEIAPGTDLPAAIVAAAAAAGEPLADGDVVVVTSKIVSKAEGRTVELADVEPSPFAVAWSATWDKDPAVTEVVLREAKRVVRQLGPVLITETHHGFVCANSGVDQSSSGAHGRLVLLPVDPDQSARDAARRVRGARRRRRGHRLRHVRPGVARRPDRHRHRRRRVPADLQLHRPGRSARPRVPGPGGVHRRRAGRRRRAGEGQRLARPGRRSSAATPGSATTPRRSPPCCATSRATCSADDGGLVVRFASSSRRGAAGSRAVAQPRVSRPCLLRTQASATRRPIRPHVAQRADASPRPSERDDGGADGPAGEELDERLRGVGQAVELGDLGT